ncbi:hypothetical protein AGMMS49975_29530 [Clostridia bacterium]|nr:hypothetical protein AGMMS49975_29530 [Clostridia bacterium]
MNKEIIYIMRCIKSFFSKLNPTERSHFVIITFMLFIIPLVVSVSARAPSPDESFVFAQTEIIDFFVYTKSILLLIAGGVFFLSNMFTESAAATRQGFKDLKNPVTYAALTYLVFAGLSAFFCKNLLEKLPLNEAAQGGGLEQVKLEELKNAYKLDNHGGGEKHRDYGFRGDFSSRK